MSLPRRIANLTAALAQAAVPALGYAGSLGRTVDPRYQVIKTPVVPATYAFSIWSAIFLTGLVYAIEQARPSRADDPLLRRIGWLTAAAFAANAVWSVLAQLEYPLVLTGLTLLVGVTAILLAADRVFRSEPAIRGSDRWTVALPVGMLAGWLSVAIFANWSVVLADWNFADRPSRTLQALAFLAGAGLTAAVMIRRTGGAWPYVGVVAWALVALIVGNVQRGDPALAAASAVLLILLGALTWRVRRHARLIEPAMWWPRTEGPRPASSR
ncbi:hypothetical protein [Methylobacterium nonmethylotrophicum]|uniref:Tryptophan-rich sensory protein n=1 Tax=Methylobacterium nonmethylotrophicum TaxID=1141884 RepID=A0A4Z0NCF0_9HYPH|nr:hypothetical protein [Methylobacterium nonmethylotrophicum]TGD92365.1 hypothetical protein EU555_34760 [Methylobacterium nonmethylotrophicum]